MQLYIENISDDDVHLYQQPTCWHKGNIPTHFFQQISGAVMSLLYPATFSFNFRSTLRSYLLVLNTRNTLLVEFKHISLFGRFILYAFVWTFSIEVSLKSALKFKGCVVSIYPEKWIHIPCNISLWISWSAYPPLL